MVKTSNLQKDIEVYAPNALEIYPPNKSVKVYEGKTVCIELWEEIDESTIRQNLIPAYQKWTCTISSVSVKK